MKSQTYPALHTAIIFAESPVESPMHNIGRLAARYSNNFPGITPATFGVSFSGNNNTVDLGTCFTISECGIYSINSKCENNPFSFIDSITAKSFLPVNFIFKSFLKSEFVAHNSFNTFHKICGLRSLFMEPI